MQTISRDKILDIQITHVCDEKNACRASGIFYSFMSI